MDHLTSVGLAAEAALALASEPFPLPACACVRGHAGGGRGGLVAYFGSVHRDRLEEEVAAASRAFAERPDEAAQRRLIALCTARDAVRRSSRKRPKRDRIDRARPARVTSLARGMTRLGDDPYWSAASMATKPAASTDTVTADQDVETTLLDVRRRRSSA